MPEPDMHSYPWYPRDWRESETVMRMTAEQRGIYRELLDETWLRGSLPTEEHLLVRMAQCTADEWARSRDVVLACFELRDGRLWNPKVDEKRPQVLQSKDDRKKGGKVRAQTAPRLHGRFTSSAGEKPPAGATSSPPAELQPPPSPSPSPTPRKPHASHSASGNGGQRSGRSETAERKPPQAAAAFPDPKSNPKPPDRTPELVEIRAAIAQRAAQSRFQGRARPQPLPEGVAAVVRAWLREYAGYFRVLDRLGEPDDDILARTLAAADNRPDQLASLLRMLSRQGKRPELSWGWFPAVVGAMQRQFNPDRRVIA